MKTNLNRINHRFFIKWSKPSLYRSALAAFMSALIAFPPGVVLAAPSGGSVSAGGANVSVSGNTTTINQTTGKAVIDWQSFGIKAHETVNFLQPGAAAAILNRVTGAEASQILGALNANGRVFLVNPNGILFGAGARVDVAGLMASTLNIRNEDFMAGNFQFAQDPAAQLSYVINRGSIKVADNGFAYLVAPGVENSGLIVAKGGHVALASGRQAYVDFSGEGLVKFQVTGKITEKVIGPDGQPMNAGVSNSGTIQAQGGQVLLSADTARDIVTSVVNNSGLIEAQSLDDLLGSVKITARDGGDAVNTGVVNVSAANANGDGGSVTISGENVAQLGTVSADAAGRGNAGRIDLNASGAVAVGAESVTTANADRHGNGGEIYIIGDDSAVIATGADVQAKGGAQGGDGGFVETSGHKNFAIGAAPDVSASAGKAGTWLIDPYNIEIVASTGSVNFGVTSGSYTATGNSAQIGVDLITAALATGNVLITTNGPGAQDGDITFSALLNYTGLTANTLTLEADRDILLNNSITSSATALGLTLDAGRNITQAAVSTLTLNGGDLTISNAAAVSLQAVTAGNVAINASGIVTLNNAVTTTGSLTVSAGGVTTLGTVNTVGAVVINSGSGITLGGDLNSSGNVALTAATGFIIGSGTIFANNLTLAANGAENSGIGTVTITVDGGGNEIRHNNPLNVSLTGTLNASTQSGLNPDGSVSGNIAISNSGDLLLGLVTTNGNRGVTDYASVVLESSGSISGAGAGVHLDAWLAQFTAKRDINLHTNLSVLYADAGVGYIPPLHGTPDLPNFDLLSDPQGGTIDIVNDSSSLTILGLQARQYGNIVKLRSDGEMRAVYTYDFGGQAGFIEYIGMMNLNLTTVGDLRINGAVNSTNSVNLTAGGNIMANAINLIAGGAIGQNGSAVTTYTGERVNATSGHDGIYLQEGNRLAIGTITASGSNNNVGLTTSVGNVWFGFADSLITASGGTVSLSAPSGNISILAANNSNVVVADAVVLSASTALGTAAKHFLVDAARVSAALSGNNAIFVDSAQNLLAINATSNGGSVAIHSTGANFDYTAATGALALTNGVNAALDFCANIGDLNLTGINAGANTVSLQARVGAINQVSGVLVAGDLTLSAGKNIGTDANNIQTQVSSLNAVSGSGGIYINQTGALALTATARGANSNVKVTQGGAGDLTVSGVYTSQGAVTLSSGGDIVASADYKSISGTSLNLTAGGDIGASGAPLTTTIGVVGGVGAYSVSANGGVYLANNGNGALSFSANTNGAGDLEFSHAAGNLALGSVNVGNAHDITLSAGGQITDANGATLNLTANTLTLTAAGDLDLNVKSSGRTEVETNHGILLGVVEAVGQAVKLIASGDITDNRAVSETKANVRADSLEIAGVNLGTAAKPLALDVAMLDSSGGDVFADNLGQLHVTAALLVGKGVGKTVRLTASGISIFDNGGGSTTLDDNGSLELIAKNGNIVFLNTNDTLAVTGTGHISMEAHAGLPAGETGLSGLIIVGNLATAGGDITLQADSHIGIGLLNATASGTVTVRSANGYIIDGNGAANNIIANHAILSGKSLAPGQAALDLSEAAADVGDRNNWLNVMNTLQTNQGTLTSTYQALQALYEAAHNTAVADVARTEGDMNSAQVNYDAAYYTFYAAQIAFDLANVACSIAEVPVAIAQAIPFTGDGGAATALSVVKIALAALQTAADAASLAVDVMADRLGDATNANLLAQSQEYSSRLSLEGNTQLLETSRDALADYTEKLAKAVNALAASKIIEEYTQKAYDNNNVIGTQSQALGVQAERVDATAFGQSNIYMESPTGLGLGNITANGVNTSVEITAKNGDVTILGKTESTKDIVVYSALGAVSGSGGQLVTKDLSIIAQTGIGDNVGGTPIYTQVERIAAVTASGGAKFVNTNGINPLTVDEINVVTQNITQTVSGITANGDILVQTTTDLILNKAVTDSGGHSATLEATGGSVTGADIQRHVTTGTLTVSASTGIGTAAIPLRTDVEKITATVTGSGNIEIDERDAVELTSVSAENGHINIKSNGNMNAVSVLSLTDAAGNTINLNAASGNITVGTITAGANNGNITLSAANGQVNNDGNTATLITGHTLTITANSGIGAVGANANISLDTRVYSLNASTGSGPLNISEVDDLLVTNAVTGNGDITITGGTLTLINVAANGAGNTVTLDAVTGAIVSGNSGANVITAETLAAIAATGIGSAGNPIYATISNLEALTNSGGIYINDPSGDLTIGGVTPGLGKSALTGVTVSGIGEIVITTPGNLTANETVLTGSGAIKLTSGGTATLNAAVTATTGAITISATNDIISTTNGAVDSGSGAITFTAGDSIETNAIVSTTIGNIAFTSGLDIITNAPVTTGTGQIDFIAARNINNNDLVSTGSGALNFIATTGSIWVNGTAVTAHGDATMIAATDIHIDQTVAALNGNVTLTASTGAITGGAANPPAYHVIGGTLTATAALGIGSDLTAIRTDIATLIASVTGAGDIVINEKDAVVLENVSAADGHINITAGGSIDAVNIVSLTDSIGNNTTLTATSGDIIAHTITAGADHGDITLSATTGQVNNDGDTATLITGHTLSITANSGIGAVGANANISLDTQVYSLNASTVTGPLNISEADDLLITNAVTGNGDITITGASGTLTLINIAANGSGNTVTLDAATGAIVSGAAGANVITAENLAAIAATGIGIAGNPIYTNISNLEALTNSGGIYINNQNGDLTIGGVTPGSASPR